MNTSRTPSVNALGGSKPPLPSLLNASPTGPSSSSQEMSASFSEMLRSKVQTGAPAAPKPAAPAPAEAPKPQADSANSAAKAESQAAGRSQDANRLQQNQQEQRRLQERQQQARHEASSADKAANASTGKRAEKPAEAQDSRDTEAASERAEDTDAETTAAAAQAAQQPATARPLTEQPAGRGSARGGIAAGDASDTALPADAAALLAGPGKGPGGPNGHGGIGGAIGAGAAAKGGKAEADAALQKAGLEARALPAQGQDGVTASTGPSSGPSAGAASLATPGQPSFESLLSAAAAQQSQPASDGVSSPATHAPAHLALAPGLHESGFAPEMAARLSVLAADGVQEARLHLNPAEMGPVLVQIQVDGQQAQISFHAEQAETRSVLENSLPELAAALRENGLTLSGGGVFQQARDPGQPGGQEASQGGSRQAAAAQAGGTAPAEVGTLVNAPRPPPSRGVLDMYA